MPTTKPEQTGYYATTESNYVIYGCTSDQQKGTSKAVLQLDNRELAVAKVGVRGRGYVPKLYAKLRNRLQSKLVTKQSSTTLNIPHQFVDQVKKKRQIQM